MGTPNTFLTITPVPFLSVLIWIALILLAMYLGRKPFHRSMDALCRVIERAMRLAASSVKEAEKQLQTRNREVLMSAGLELAERKVEREFDRISAAVKRDLEGYPEVQRQMNEQLKSLEEDYEKCAEIPQTLPDWVKVIDAIANIRPSGDRMVVNMLEEIHKTLREQHKAAVEDHRRAVSNRHKVLSHLLPVFRSIQTTVGVVEKTFNNLTQRSMKVDRYMDNYEKIRSQTDMAARQLASSSLTQFFISGLVLAVAAVGAIINFNLVALPMSEMVGGASYIGGFKTSDVAGMFIVCLEIVVGIFLMDSLRITRLFSIIGGLEDNKRKIIFWILLTMLSILAGVESSLAFMRDRIAMDMEALRQSLASVESSGLASSNIPTIGQMIMGFILPFILTFVAIPFESFVSSTRTVIGIASEWFLRILTFLLGLLGDLGFHVGRFVVNVYDVIIFPTLWLEGMIIEKISRKKSKGNIKDETAKDKHQEQVSSMEYTVRGKEVTE